MRIRAQPLATATVPLSAFGVGCHSLIPSANVNTINNSIARSFSDSLLFDLRPAERAAHVDFTRTATCQGREDSAARGIAPWHFRELPTGTRRYKELAESELRNRTRGFVG